MLLKALLPMILFLYCEIVIMGSQTRTLIIGFLSIIRNYLLRDWLIVHSSVLRSILILWAFRDILKQLVYSQDLNIGTIRAITSKTYQELFLIWIRSLLAMIFLNHSLSIAAYESARHAVAKQAVNTEVENRCNELLTDRGVLGATITLAPGDIATAVPGQQVTVTISAECAANAKVFPLWFFHGHTMTSSVTMVREDT